MMLSMEIQPKILKKRRLGVILMERGLITEDQLDEALHIQSELNGYLGKILVELGYLTERDIVVALVVQCHIPYIAIDEYEIDQDVVDLIPGEFAHQYNVMPLDRVNKILSVVMADPFDTDAKIELQQSTKCRLMTFIATHDEIDRAIHRWYGN